LFDIDFHSEPPQVLRITKTDLQISKDVELIKKNMVKKTNIFVIFSFSISKDIKPLKTLELA